MAAAHHAAQRPPYPLPAHPSSNSFPPDDLRLPSIKDLQFHYQPRRQDHPQSSEPAPGYDHNHLQPQDRVVRHSQRWARAPPPSHSIPQAPPPPSPSNPAHQPHPQQHTSQPPPQAHEPPPKPPDYHHRHENNGYATPGLPLSAQTAPVPGSVNSGPAVRNEDYHPHVSHKRARTGDRTPVIALCDTRPPSGAYHYPPSYPATGMPPPSPYHQSGPSPPHPTHSSPSPHQIQHHHPLPPQQSYGNYHHHSHYSQPPPPRSTNVPHPIPISAPPPPPVQTPTTPLPPHTPTSTSAQATHVLSYVQSAPSSASQEWETPPPPQPPQSLQHFQHYPAPTTHHPPPPPPPAATSPAPTTPSTHHVQQQPHSHHPPPAPLVHSQPPQQTAHSVYQQQQQQAQTMPQALAPAPAPTQPYAKTMSINTSGFDTRASYSNTAPSGGSSPDSTMSELVNLCSILYDFASRYAQLNGSVPGPTPHEIAEMASRANEVVRLLEELRRSNGPEGQRSIKNDMASAEDHRPPKRPWEDMDEEGQVSPDDYQQQEAYEPNTVEPAQSTAEQDMELIRTKRATTTAGVAANAGQPKSKYRKRSRATPPGKCHSCNIRETPEWRRGPDGARTLCNACGLHYAKLMRKQNKMNPGPNGEPPPPIDMDMLRASTRAAEAEKNGVRPKDDGSPTGAPTHHQGSFQVITMAQPVHNEPPPAISPTTSEHQQAVNAPISVQASSSISTTASVLHIPPPPWSTSPPVNGRGYQPTEQSQQSFVRSSIPANSPR